MARPFTFGAIRYQAVEPVSHSQHAGLGVRPEAWLGVAAELPSAPLLATELIAACRDFPVVFTTGERITPLALFHVGTGPNTLVTDTGWRADTYIPSALRRYPFVFSAADEQGDRTLCVDTAALTPDGGRPLFNGEAPGEIVTRAARYCTAFQREMEETFTFGQVVEAAGLFTLRSLKVSSPDGRTVSPGDVRVVDTEKLAALPTPVLSELHRSGALGLVYAHIISLGNLNPSPGQRLRPPRRARDGCCWTG